MNHFCILLVIFSVGGCAATAGLIERESIDRAKFNKAMDECRLYADSSERDKNMEASQLIKNCMRERGYEI